MNCRICLDDNYNVFLTISFIIGIWRECQNFEMGFHFPARIVPRTFPLWILSLKRKYCFHWDIESVELDHVDDKGHCSHHAWWFCLLCGVQLDVSLLDSVIPLLCSQLDSGYNWNRFFVKNNVFGRPNSTIATLVWWASFLYHTPFYVLYFYVKDQSKLVSKGVLSS